MSLWSALVVRLSAVPWLGLLLATAHPHLPGERRRLSVSGVIVGQEHRPRPVLAKQFIKPACVVKEQLAIFRQFF